MHLRSYYLVVSSILDYGKDERIGYEPQQLLDYLQKVYFIKIFFEIFI